MTDLERMNVRITDYKIIEAKSADSLAEFVNGMIRDEGFQPFGNAFAVIDRQNYTKFFQPIVRFEEPPA